MLWKVYNIQSGKIIRAGFGDEEEARAWLEKHRPDTEDNYQIEEMDDDEEAEWEEKGSLADQAEDDEDDQSFERDRYNYSTEEDDDMAEEDPEDLLTEVDEDEYDD